MDQQIAENEIARQLLDLLDKAGLEAFSPFASAIDRNSRDYLETILISLRNLNAKYDKNEAIQHIHCLMDKYNIQLDQLVDQRGLA